MMGMIQCNKPDTRCLASSPGNGHFGLSVDLCSWQVGYSAMTLAQIGLDE